jgi:hypothetical protein
MLLLTFVWPSGKSGQVFIPHRKARVEPETGRTIPGQPPYMLPFTQGKCTTTDAWEIHWVKETAAYKGGAIDIVGHERRAPSTPWGGAPARLAVSGAPLLAAIEKALSGPALTEEQVEFGGLQL